MPEAGVEPARPQGAPSPQDGASANSATPASIKINITLKNFKVKLQ